MKGLILFLFSAAMAAAQLVPHVFYPNNGELRWWDTDQTHWMGFRFPAANLSANQMYTFPSANGAGSLVNDGAGNLSWGAGAAGADLNTANIFTQRQRVASSAVFPAWISSFTGGRASSFWNGSGASVISFDSAGQLLFQAASNSEIVDALGTGTYVMMIKNDGKVGIGFSSAGTSLSEMLEVNGVALASQLAVDHVHGDGIEGRIRALGVTADRTYDLVDRSGFLALEDAGSLQTLLNILSTTQGAVIYRGASGWEALAPGTAGQVLSTNGTGANPSWIAAGSGSGDVVGPASSTSGNLPSFNGTTGKLLQDSGVGVSDVARKSTTNTFTQPQTIAKSGSPYPAFISSATGGKAASLWNGGDASVLTFDSAGQLLFQAAANSDILAANAAGTYVGMIKGDGKFGVGFSSASQVLDHMLEVNGVAVGSQLAVEGTADAFEGFFRNLGGLTDDRFYEVPDRSGNMALEDSTSAVALLNALSMTQGAILYRNGSTWVPLAPGTSGQFLKTQGAAANPIWDTPSGSGNVTSPGTAVTNEQIVVMDGTSGTAIKQGSTTIATLRDAATAFTSNTVPVARLGTGTANSTTYLRGDGTWQTAGDVTGPGSAVSGNLASFNGTTGKIIQDSALPTAQVPLKNAANTFVERQTIESGSVFPAFVSAYTGGRASSFWNGGTASVLSFDSAGQLLFQVGSNADIKAGNGAGSYVGMIKSDGKMGVGFTSAGHTLDHMLEANGVVVGSQLAVEGTADAFEGFFRNLGGLTADRFYEVPDRDGNMALEDNTSFQAMADSVSTTQGAILYRNASDWVALTPGTSGQYLKTQGTGANPVWDSPSGSGAVGTDAIWDAKGDLAGGTGSNTAARLPVGTNGQVLTADSAEATGMKWATPSSGSSSDNLDYDKWHIGTYTFQSNTTIVATNFSAASVVGTATADTDGTATRLKNISYASAATTNSDAGFTSNVPIGHVQQDWDVKWTGGLDTLTDVRFIGGMGENLASVASNDLPGASAAAWFRYSTSAGDTTWKCLSDDDAAGSATVTDSGVTVTTRQVRFRITKTATAVTFYINGTQVAQHTATASIPDVNDGTAFIHRARTLANAAATCYFSQAEIRHRIP